MRFIVYLAGNGSGGRLDLSPDPAHDLGYLSLKGYRWAAALTPSLPVGEAVYVLNVLGGSGAVPAHRFSWWHWRKPSVLEELLPRLRKQVGKILCGIGLTAQAGPETIWRSSPSFVQVGDRELDIVFQVLAGRVLLFSEIVEALSKHGINLSKRLPFILQNLYLEGRCRLLAAVERLSNRRFRCNRCGETRRIVTAPCGACGHPQGAYCEECLTLGVAGLCDPLYAFLPENQTRSFPYLEPCLKIELSPAQREAALLVKQFLNGFEKACLVWAVCGAGKTEVTFAGIAQTLQKGGRILYAVPRRDVVKELTPRFSRAFPEVPLASLYGGSRQKYREAQFVLATTHQVTRFYRNFDLVVLDEADAYPYRGSRMLHYAVERARRPEGKIVYLTATPAADLRRLKTVIKIPARYHRYPLPEPRLLVQKIFQQNGLAPGILDFLRRSVEVEGAQVLVFVPSIALAERVGRSLQRAAGRSPFSGWSSDAFRYSYARDQAREAKRQAFYRGEFPVFITTTIMERGVTVKKVNVLVLYAGSEKIFNTETLVQMAGRSGRTVENPQGEVWFLAERISASMEKARNWIRRFNREARQKGFLIPSGERS